MPSRSVSASGSPPSSGTRHTASAMGSSAEACTIAASPSRPRSARTCRAAEDTIRPSTATRRRSSATTTCTIRAPSASAPAPGRKAGLPWAGLHPDGVLVGPDLPGRAGVGVGHQHGGPALVARQHLQRQRAAGLPAHVDEVGQRLAVPGDRRRRPVEVDHRQRDVRVGGARGRVARRDGGDVRVDRRGDPPRRNRGDVDARGDQALPVRGPPVAARAVHLLGGDELGEAPRHVGVVVVQQSPRGAGRSRVDPEPTVAHERDPGAGRVGSRIDDRAFDRGLHGGAGRRRRRRAAARRA